MIDCRLGRFDLPFDMGLTNRLLALYALDMDGLVESMNKLDNLYLSQREDGL